MAERHPIIYEHPMRYPKINTLFMRDQTRTVKRKGIIIPHFYSEEAFKTIKWWKASEKVDGENVRIYIDFIPGNLSPPHVWIGSRNDVIAPNINEDALSYIKTHLTEDALKAAFTKGSFTSPDSPRHIMIFGEAFGGKIKHGHDYRDSPEFIIFDIVIDDWVLEYNNVEAISKKLNLESVPYLSGLKSIEEIVNFVKSQPPSIISNKPHVMEGLVCTSAPLLLTRNGYPVRFKLKTKDYLDLDSVTTN